ncbi:CGNR zinc finger domain-containing protein [Streptomyces sp. ST2-7A]|uniref:CGNR zinc finger domain-containing protein n=1 Tax=Streptomyces sp. ST2-7A TaxID=2907214 RepID=UPI001F1A5291|nr:CGNR zinc finger domain-containing protein [Streptomyces sp. ST2-7A]MCE7082851.1 CGNR zinc finger domain-containing protein [Streptomyces sp. ST2-7A]
MSAEIAPGGLVLVQELVNTLDVETARDALTSVGDLAEFSERHSLPRLPPTEIAELVRLREALRAVLLVHAGHLPTGVPIPPVVPTPASGPGPGRIDTSPADPTAELNRLLTIGPLLLRVDTGGAATLVPVGGLRGVSFVTARVAAAVAEGVREGNWWRLKACEAPNCQWAYYDRSPAGRRRWCSMRVCGSRAKMRAYRARRRDV